MAVAAVTDASGTLVVARSAVAGQYAVVGPAGSSDVAGDRRVWAVVVQGTFAPIGGCPSGFECLGLDETVRVVLDPATGAVLAQERPAPGLAPDSGAGYATAVMYEVARTSGDWDRAWRYVSPIDRERFGLKQQAFVEAETAYNAAGGTTFEIGVVVPFETFHAKSPELFSDGLMAALDRWVDVSEAWVVTISHPGIDGASAGSRAYVVGAVESVDWRVWILH